MATTATSSANTIGMRLDAAIDQLDSLSSTQLYGIIVAATVGLCMVLLGTGHADVELKQQQQHQQRSTTATTPKPSSSSSSNNTNTVGRQPRWHIFRWINYLCMGGFVYSLAHFGHNASYYLYQQPDQLIHFLVGWSVFLGYFFGFFGVSLVHQDMLVQQQEGNATTVEEIVTTKGVPPAGVEEKKSRALHKPADSTPVCSDPTSFKKTPKSLVPTNLKELANEDIAQLVLKNQLKDHELEKRLDPFRAVDVRRIAANAKLASVTGKANILDSLPTSSSPSQKQQQNNTTTPALDYSKVLGANCEIVVGYVPIPVGLVGPLTLNDSTVYVPMATTEGCLVASTNRGAKAISQGSGAHARIVRDGITRAPCVRMASAMEAADLKLWCEEPTNFQILKNAFESTTSFGKLQACHPTIAGKNVYLRLVCFSGDAMGMNMVSKGSLAVIERLQMEFPSLQLVALSGNMCTDKKAAATNWLQGRGKSVVVEATIPKKVVQTTLKTTVGALVHTNIHKNLIGSAMAGALGGFNAHASNIVTAVFLATGQDPAQNVESSNCITLMEETDQGDLWICCTMPSIEVGTVGGGTSLAAQATCLEAMGVKGSGQAFPGENAQKLATIVAAATMAGELSLLAALAANTLVQAHMTHNRKPATTKK